MQGITSRDRLRKEKIIKRMQQKAIKNDDWQTIQPETTENGQSMLCSEDHGNTREVLADHKRDGKMTYKRSRGGTRC